MKLTHCEPANLPKRFKSIVLVLSCSISDIYACFLTFAPFHIKVFYFCLHRWMESPTFHVSEFYPIQKIVFRTL